MGDPQPGRAPCFLKLLIRRPVELVLFSILPEDDFLRELEKRL